MQYKVCYKDWGITFGKANINHLYLVPVEKKTTFIIIIFFGCSSFTIGFSVKSIANSMIWPSAFLNNFQSEGEYECYYIDNGK